MNECCIMYYYYYATFVPQYWVSHIGWVIIPRRIKRTTGLRTTAGDSSKTKDQSLPITLLVPFHSVPSVDSLSPLYKLRKEKSNCWRLSSTRFGENLLKRVTTMADSSVKKLSLKDVEDHKDKKSCWIVINDSVYDVTKFLEEHPGGEEVLLEQAGKDATENFEDVGHSTDARTMMKDYFVGEIIDEEKTNTPEKRAKKWTADNGEPDNASSWKTWVIPMALALTASLIFRFFFITSKN